jgi:hypothetical protein
VKRASLWTRTVFLLAALSLGISAPLAADSPGSRTSEQPAVAKSKQLIVWTSGDREVALKMVFMYAANCKKRGWMDQVRLLVWGPSGKLLTEDEELQKGLAGLKAEGVELYACKGCADLYGISDKLSALGIDVMYTGTMLADAQKDPDWHVLTF